MNVFESFLIKQVLIFKVFPSPIEPFKIIIACCRIYILTVLCCHLSNGVMLQYVSILDRPTPTRYTYA